MAIIENPQQNMIQIFKYGTVVTCEKTDDVLITLHWGALV